MSRGGAPWGPALALALTVALGLSAQPIPPARGNVSDFVEALSPALETRLEAAIRDLRRRGVQVAVATIETARPRTPKEWATAAFQKWGVGEAGVDNGLLVLLSVGDRRVEIEVGYGLEARLTDAQAGAILDEYAVPAFRKDEWGLGLSRILLGLRRHFDAPTGPPRFGLPAAAPEGLWTLGVRLEPEDRARIDEALRAVAPTGIAVTLAAVRSPAPPAELTQELTRRWTPLSGDPSPRVVVMLHGPALRIRTTGHPELAPVDREHGRWLSERVRPFMRGEDPRRARLPGTPSIPGVESAALAALAEGLAEVLGHPLPGPGTLARRSDLVARAREAAKARLREQARAQRLEARPHLPSWQFRDTWPELEPWQLTLGEATHSYFWLAYMILLVVISQTIPNRVVELTPKDAASYPSKTHREEVRKAIGEGRRLVDPPRVIDDAWWICAWLMVPAGITGCLTGSFGFLWGLPLLLVAAWASVYFHERQGRCPCCDRLSWGLRHTGLGQREVGIGCRELQGPASVETWWLGEKGPRARVLPRVSLLAWLLRMLAAGAFLTMSGALLVWGGPWRWALVLASPVLVFVAAQMSVPEYRRAPKRNVLAKIGLGTRASSHTASYPTVPSYTSTPTTSSTNSWTSYTSSSSSSYDDDDDWSSYGGGSSGGGGAGRSF